MNKETHEQEIEVELLNPEELETQEEEIELSAFALDGDLIEALYQEQVQEQQTEEPGQQTEEPGQADREGESRLTGSRSAGTDRTAVSEKTDTTEEKQSEKIVLPDAEMPEEIEVPDKIVLDEADLPETEEMAVKGAAAEDIPAGNMAGESMAVEGITEKGMSAESVAGESAAAKDITGEGSAENDMAEEVVSAKSTVTDDAAANGTVAESGIAVGTAHAEEAEPDDQEISEGEADDEGTEEKPKKKKGVVRKILKGILITFEALILALIVYVVAIIVQADSTTDLISRLSQSMLGKAVLSAVIQEDYEGNVQETIDSEQISTNEGLDVTPYTLEGDYTSFVIFGVDARGDEFDSGTNSDTIIIVTIQNETGRVRMASIYRDTYLQIESSNGDVHYAKANSAYSSGGAVRAINMLNTNFDLALEDYVVVNFTGVADIIDALGGLDITLSEGEVEQLNYHLAGSIYATGLSGDKISSAGLNHLNGVQALTYARIRKTVFTDPETGEEYNNDYGRTKRQQYVISLLAAKAKEATVSELTSIVNRVFSYNTDEEKVIGTTYSFSEIISMIPLALDFTLDGGEGYPDNKTTMIMSDLNGADCVIATDLVSDVTALHEYLYDEEDYSPTATVRNIANTILERAENYGTSD